MVGGERGVEKERSWSSSHPGWRSVHLVMGVGGEWWVHRSGVGAVVVQGSEVFTCNECRG